MFNRFEEGKTADPRGKLVSFYIKPEILERVDSFKERGICVSRTEALHMCIISGLRGLEPNMEEIEQAAKVLADLKQDALE
tara:strand:+ start:9526 stop:9768 length:243 start_codon:yes stop_codon:yes gene_type:complete